MPFLIMAYGMIAAYLFFIFVILICKYRDRKQVQFLKVQTPPTNVRSKCN